MRFVNSVRRTRDAVALSAIILILLCGSQHAAASVHFDKETNVFRLDGGDITYVIGLNRQGEVQTLYWGERLPENQQFPAAQAISGLSSFEMPVNTTPQEYTGWGGALYVEPDLKVTFSRRKS